jgi:hypothetical protein
LSYLIAAFDE